MGIAQRLREARKAMGYTLQEAARLTGFCKSSISNFENGAEPRFSQLVRFAEVYRRRIEWFLEEGKRPDEPVLLWRDKPETESCARPVEMEFRQICEQYHRLECLMKASSRQSWPPVADRFPAEGNPFYRARTYAEKVGCLLQLGERPSQSLRQVLEEDYGVKIFHLELNEQGSAISTYSPRFGPAVLLNAKSKAWRRNFDLAHELFHLLTWEQYVMAPGVDEGTRRFPSALEEQMANAFASVLLLPASPLKRRIDAVRGNSMAGGVSLDVLDEIAREFGVSLEALLWRLVSLYDIPPDKIQEYIARIPSLRVIRPPRQSDKPDKFPERYWSLALAALREGRLSLAQFAKYVDISYHEAQLYLREDEGFTDEAETIPLSAS